MKIPCLLLVGLLTGCGASKSSGDTTPSRTVLVGTVGSGKALIALVHDEQGLTAYTCGIGEALATHTGWFFSTPGGTEFHGVQSAGGLTLDGSVSSSQASGTLTLASGEQLPFSAAPALGGAGLYADEDTVALTGLIVNNDGVMAGNAKLSGVGAGTTGSVAVSVPAGAPGAATVTAQGPTVIFLVHGMSDNINTNDVNAPEDPVTARGWSCP